MLSRDNLQEAAETTEEHFKIQLAPSIISQHSLGVAASDDATSSLQVALEKWCELSIAIEDVAPGSVGLSCIVGIAARAETD